MDVSIVLINYKTPKLTCDCIKSIKEKSAGFSYEIIVIDNKSDDDSIKEINALGFDNVYVVENEDNEGTARAFNKGAKLAKGKYVFWLNTDTLLLNNAIFELFTFMESHPECGIAGGNLYKDNGEPNFSFRKPLFDPKAAIKELSLFGQLRLGNAKYFNKHFFNNSDTPIIASHISGADLFIRQDVFREVGYFDDRIFMYAEETEFEYRVQSRTNYKSYNVPTSKIVHLEGGSFTGDPTFNEFRFFHNILGFTKLYYFHFGKEMALKYLKAYKKSLNFRLFICKMLRKKNAISNNIARRDMIVSYINNFDKFINSFKYMD